MESLSPAPIRFRSQAAIRFRSRPPTEVRHLRFSHRTRSRRFRPGRRARFQLLLAKKPTSLFPPPHRVHTVPSLRQRATRRPRNSRPIVLRRCGSKSICPSRRRSRGPAIRWGLATAARAIPTPEGEAGFGVVVSHPGDKNNDIAKVGQPACSGDYLRSGMRNCAAGSPRTI
jgi:hypothetical protein